MSLTVEFYEIPVFTFPQVYAQVGEYNYGLVYVDECCFDFVPCLVEHFARNGQIPVKPGVPQSATLRWDCQLVHIPGRAVFGVGSQFEHGRVGVPANYLEVQGVGILLLRHFDCD